MAKVSIKYDDNGKPLSRTQIGGPPMAGFDYKPEDVMDVNNTGYTSMVSDIQNRILNPMKNYDVYNDPAYKALELQANELASSQMAQAQEQLNKRGILDSTITAKNLGDIQKTASRNLTMAIPELVAAQQEQRQRELSNLIQLENLMYGRGRDQLADERYIDELKYNRNRDLVSDERQARTDEWNKAFDLWSADPNGRANAYVARTLGIPEGTVNSTQNQLDVKRKQALEDLAEERKYQEKQDLIKYQRDLAIANARGNTREEDIYGDMLKTQTSINNLFAKDKFTYGESDMITEQQALNRARVLNQYMGQYGEEYAVGRTRGANPDNPAEYGEWQYFVAPKDVVYGMANKNKVTTEKPKTSVEEDAKKANIDLSGYRTNNRK